jgi:hypothetical protein
MLGDRAYDSAELRQWLSERGTKPVVPNKSNRKQAFSFDRKSYKQRHRSRTPSAGSRISDASQLDTIGSPETSSPRSALLPLLYGGFIESWP